MPAEQHSHPWIVAVEIAAEVALPTGDALDREAACGWLWGEFGAAGLVGVDEGAIDVTEAAAIGLVPGPLVIDAAAAPADRDWVAGRGSAAVGLWFVDEATARAAAARLDGLHGCRVRGVRPAAAGAGDRGWQAGFTSIDIPGFGTIKPAWEPGLAVHAPDGATMFIDPGAGFGTGSHETTQLCLEALGGWRRAGRPLDRVLDFGSGSGVLGIAAAVCGAGRVDAIEIDTRVHEAILANARRNGVADRMHVAAHAPAECRCDLVFANIVAAVLLEHAETLCDSLRPGGGLVLSGLRAADLAAVRNRYADRLRVEPLLASRGEWWRLVFATPDGPP